MGLDMHTKHKITAVTAQRYRTADRKGTTAILDEFTATTGYNRKYALRVLANGDSTRLTRVEGKTVKLKAARRRQAEGLYRPGHRRPGKDMGLCGVSLRETTGPDTEKPDPVFHRGQLFRADAAS